MLEMNRLTIRKKLSSFLETPVALLLIKLGLSPNKITVLGLIIAVLSAYLISVGELAFGGVALLVSGLFDILDGAVARLSDKETKYGSFLDSVTDRISESVILLGLLIYFLDISSTWGAVLTYTAVVGSIGVSYARARAEGLGIECKIGIMTRPERVATLVIGLITGSWWMWSIYISLTLISSLNIFTFVQRILEVKRSLDAKKIN